MSKQKIKKFLSEKKIYHPGYDYLIDILCSQISLYNESKRTIKDEGISTFGSSEQTFKVRNQHFKTLSECIANILKLSEKLGINPKDCLVISQLIGEHEEADDFEELDDFEP